MHIVYHIGVHCTDEGQIFSCLNRNRRLLARQGIVVAHPAKFKPILRETLKHLQGAEAPEEMQEMILDGILAEDHPKRIIFSNESFLSGYPRILVNGTLYPDAAEKSRRLANLFPGHEMTFCMAIRDPATFLPACFAKVPAQDFTEFLSQIDPTRLLWSEVIARIRAALPPEAALKVWRNEEIPFIWRELMAEISGHDPDTKLAHLDDILGKIMTADGLARMQAYMESHPPANERQRRRILDAFLDKFEAEDEALNVTSPIWTDEYVAALTETYDADLFEIEQIPGVQVIAA